MDLIEYDIIGDKIRANFQNACCTPIEFFVEENLGNWHPRTHGPRNYLQIFYLAALIHKCRGKKYPYAEHQNFTGNRKTGSFQKENDNNGNSSSSFDDDFTPKYRKSFGQNKKAKFNEFMVRKCDDLLEADKVLFKTRKFLPQFVLSPLRAFLNLKLDRLSLL